MSAKTIHEVRQGSVSPRRRGRKPIADGALESCGLACSGGTMTGMWLAVCIIIPTQPLSFSWKDITLDGGVGAIAVPTFAHWRLSPFHISPAEPHQANTPMFDFLQCHPK